MLQCSEPCLNCVNWADLRDCRSTEKRIIHKQQVYLRMRRCEKCLVSPPDIVTARSKRQSYARKIPAVGSVASKSCTNALQIRLKPKVGGMCVHVKKSGRLYWRNEGNQRELGKRAVCDTRPAVEMMMKRSPESRSPSDRPGIQRCDENLSHPRS